MLTPPRFPKLPRPKSRGHASGAWPDFESKFGLAERAAGQGRAARRLAPRPHAWTSQRHIHDPCVRHSDVGRRIPITVLIKTSVKAVAVRDVYDLRELDVAIGCHLESAELDASHLLVGLHLPDRQIARAHVYDFLVVHLGGNGVVTDLADFVLAVLIEFRSQQIVPVTVMLVSGKSGSTGEHHAGRQHKAQQHTAIDHVNSPFSWIVDAAMPPRPTEAERRRPIGSKSLLSAQSRRP